MDIARTTTTTQAQTNSDATSGTSQSSAMRTSPLYAGSPAVRLGSGSGAGTAMPPQVSELVASPGSGESLQPPVQRALEGSYKVGMGAVRVHTDARSSSVTDSVSARAFTYGPNIFLGTGERASDVGLMAHEGAHVVQQQGSPVMQMSADAADTAGTPASDTYEQEARSASLAVQQGQSFAVLGRTSEQRVQKEDVPWWKRGLRAVASVASAGKDLLLKKAADRAKKIPGYDLLTVILGKDPITDKPVERNAVNLLRGIAGLIPGGSEMFDNLQKSGALQKAFDWFSAEVAKLNLSWEMIKGLFRQFWDALSSSDILNPSGVLEKLEVIFAPPLKRLADFALAGGKKILELIFEGALSLAGAFGQQILAVFRKAANVFSLIVNDPLGFLRNLLQAVKGGFQNFAKNILKHLKNALFEWLFGALSGAGLTLPDKFDLRGILSIVLQVLGLTYARMREKLVKLIGEPAVAFIEKAFEFLKLIVTQGIAAAWQKLLEFATGLVDTVIEGIRNWVVKSIVEAAVTKLVTMFNPVGAIIQGIITIYNTVAFFVERAKQIAALASAIFDSISNIATGKIGAAIEYVEMTMARGLVVIISFLARLVGLGGISNEIKKIIQKIQSVVDNAINKVVNFIVDKVKGLIGKGKEVIGKVVNWWKAKTQFEGDDREKHTLYFSGDGDKATLMIASVPTSYVQFIESITVDEKTAAAKQKALDKAREIDALKGQKDDDGTKSEKMRRLLNQLATLTKPLVLGTVDIPPSIVKYGPLKNGGATYMKADILSKKHPEGSDVGDDTALSLEANKRIGGGSSFYVQGHLLNRRLGGPGKSFNLTPISRRANAIHSTRAEQLIIAAIEGGKIKAVRYHVVVIYEQHPKRSFLKALESRIGTPQEKADDKKKRDFMQFEERSIARAFQLDWATLKLDGKQWVTDQQKPAFSVLNDLPDGDFKMQE